MDGLTVSASYTPSNGTTEVESSSDYGIVYTGIEGLTIGATQGEDNTSSTAGVNWNIVCNPYIWFFLSWLPNNWRWFSC